MYVVHLNRTARGRGVKQKSITCFKSLVAIPFTSRCEQINRYIKQPICHHRKQKGMRSFNISNNEKQEYKKLLYYNNTMTECKSTDPRQIRITKYVTVRFFV